MRVGTRVSRRSWVSVGIPWPLLLLVLPVIITVYTVIGLVRLTVAIVRQVRRANAVRRNRRCS